MKSFELIGELRKENTKKNAKELRSQGKVPCVLYGGKENVHFSVDEISLGKVIYTSEVFLVSVSFGSKKVNGIIQEIQFHPVTDKVIHVDFIEAVEGKPVVVNLPISLSGNSKGVDKGGKLNISKRYLKVKGIVDELPEKINIDITKLNIGDNIKVANVATNNFELLDTPSTLVVSVITSRAAIKAEGVDDLDDDEESGEENPAEGAEAAAEQTQEA